MAILGVAVLAVSKIASHYVSVVAGLWASVLVGPGVGAAWLINFDLSGRVGHRGDAWGTAAIIMSNRVDDVIRATVVALLFTGTSSRVTSAGNEPGLAPSVGVSLAAGEVIPAAILIDFDGLRFPSGTAGRRALLLPRNRTLAATSARGRGTF